MAHGSGASWARDAAVRVAPRARRRVMSAASRRLAVVRVAGLLPYADGLARQAALAAQRAQGGGVDTLLLVEVRVRCGRCVAAARRGALT